MISAHLAPISSVLVSRIVGSLLVYSTRSHEFAFVLVLLVSVLVAKELREGPVRNVVELVV